MEVIRRIVDLKKLSSIINIPEDFNYHTVEILVLPANDGNQNSGNQHNSKNHRAFSPEKFYGVSSIQNLDAAIKQMRDEWTRL